MGRREARSRRSEASLPRAADPGRGRSAPWNVRSVSSPFSSVPELTFHPVFLRIRAVNDIYFTGRGNAQKTLSLHFQG